MSLETEPKWRRLPEERPTQIIDAAIEVFGEHGLSGARLEDIAKRAGVSKGTIYLYFPNKEALFKDMVRTTLVARLEADERTMDAHTGTAREQIAEYMRTGWAFLRLPAVRTIARLVIGELHRFPDLVHFYMDEVVRRKYDLVTRLIRRGIETGEFRDIDPVVAARMLSAMFHAHSLWCGMRDSTVDLPLSFSDEQVPPEVLDFFFHALTPK